MWPIILVMIIIGYALLRITWLLVKPIFEFAYDTIINILMSFGLSKKAAKAIISVIIIIIILKCLI